MTAPPQRHLLDFLLLIGHKLKKLILSDMKYSLLALCSLFLAAGMATAQDNITPEVVRETYWAKGVTAESGWQDATKSAWKDAANSGWQEPPNPGEEVPPDDMMCYAASAANLIAWWQDSSYGQKLVSDAPQGIDDIWAEFVDASDKSLSSEGGEALAAINWWLTGIYFPKEEEDWNRYYAARDELEGEFPLTLPSRSSGYYNDRYVLTPDNLSDFLVDVWMYDASAECDAASTIGFGEILNDGGCISLAIGTESLNKEGEEEAVGHAITLWGVEYENDELVKIWITDSDDVEGLVELNVHVDEHDDKKIRLDNYVDGSYYIIGVYALHAAASERWVMIPEPTTAALSLLALCGLCSRRRRR